MVFLVIIPSPTDRQWCPLFQSLLLHRHYWHQCHHQSSKGHHRSERERERERERELRERERERERESRQHKRDGRSVVTRLATSNNTTVVICTYVFHQGSTNTSAILIIL